MSPAAEPNQLVITKMKPGLDIEANFAALEAHIAGILEAYKGLVVTPEYLSEAKKDRAYLNGLSKSLNQRRIEVKNQYMAPVVAFEERVKRLDAPIREASEAIDRQVKAFEEQERVTKRAELVKHYEDYAGLILDAVPFERIERVEWLHKTCNLMAAFGEVEAIVERIARDEQTLTELNLSHPTDAKTEYFATLDLAKAIARSKALDAEEERTRRFEAEKAEIMREAAGRVVPPTPIPAPPEPEKVTLTLVSNTAEVARPWTITVTCTRAQLEPVMAALQRQGLHGTVVTS
jgi:hypothetical protein